MSSACKDEVMPVEVSDLDLGDLMEVTPSPDLLDGVTVIFENQSGSQLNFIVKHELDFLDKIVDGQSYKSETLSYVYEGITTDEFFMFIQANGTYNGSASDIIRSVQASLRANDFDVYSPLLALLESGDPMIARYIGNWAPLNEHFQNVYSQFGRVPGERFSELYYDTDIGIIGFTIDDDLYVLKEIRWFCKKRYYKKPIQSTESAFLIVGYEDYCLANCGDQIYPDRTMISHAYRFRLWWSHGVTVNDSRPPDEDSGTVIGQPSGSDLTHSSSQDFDNRAVSYCYTHFMQ